MDFIKIEHEISSNKSIVNNLDLKLLVQGYASVKAAEWRYDRIVSPFNRLYVITGGDGVIFNSSHTIRLKKGYAYLIPLNATYSYACRSFVEMFYVHFNLEIFPGMDFFRHAGTVMAARLHKRAAAEIVRKARGKTVTELLQYKADLLALLSRFLADAHVSAQQNFIVAEKYRGVFAYLDNHCAHGLSPGALAASMRMSPATLSAGLKRDTGESLKSHISRHLAQMAKQKLLAGKLVKEVADDLKFGDVFYFSRFFKKHTGLSPKHYQSANMMRYK